MTTAFSRIPITKEFVDPTKFIARIKQELEMQVKRIHDIHIVEDGHTINCILTDRIITEKTATWIARRGGPRGVVPGGVDRPE